MELKQFYYPSRLYSGDEAIRKIGDFLNAGDVVLLMTDGPLYRLGLAQKVEAVFRDKVRQVIEFKDVMPNPEIEMVYRAAAIAVEQGVTAIVAVGGGSVMDAAKAVAMLATQPGPMEDYGEKGAAPTAPPLPCYVVPTTSGTGSEGSSVAVLSYGEAGKRGIWSEKLFVTAAFLDVDLMMGLSKSITASTAMDALDHAVEAYIGLDRQPVLDALCLQAIRLIYRNLAEACETGSRHAREQLSSAAFMAGLAMGQSGTGIVHSMADRLGEIYHTPHGLGIAILLPVCLRYNAPAALDRLSDIAWAMELDVGGKSKEQLASMVVDEIQRLARRIGIPERVEGDPVTPETLRSMADVTLHHFITDNNPRRPTVEELEQLFLQVLPLGQ